MIDPTHFCPGCNRVRCTCSPPDYEAHVAEESYRRGYEACVADGYGEHQLFWPVAAGEAEAALACDWRRLCTGGTFPATDGHRIYGSHIFHARPRPWPWPYRSNPLTGDPNPEAYLAGWDDAGAGLPSAIDEPEAHAVHAAALDACEPWALCRQPDLSDVLLGPWPAPAEVALAGEYDLPF